MVAMYQLSISIDKSKTGGTFTNYDTIEGVIHFKTSSDITLNSIQVKLQAVSDVVMYTESIGQYGKRSRTRYEASHKFINETVISFPPKNVRDVAKTSKFTLIPGEYSYPFQFKIPLQNTCYKEDLKDTLAHSCNKLPPSLSGLGEFANIKYFIKATAIRNNIFKAKINSFEPFVFLPIDSPSLMNRTGELKQCFVRKRFILPNKIPEIIACYATPSSTKILKYEKNNKTSESQESSSKGFFRSLFSGGDITPPPNPKRRTSSSSVATTVSTLTSTSVPRHIYRPEVKPIDLPVYLEGRFKYPAYMIPTKKPNFKLYLVSAKGPQFFQLPNGESSGLGIVYLKSLQITLIIGTSLMAKTHVTSHKEELVLLDQPRINYKFDLHDVKKSTAIDVDTGKTDIFEIEIPKEIYSDAIVPDHVAPTFKSCNIARSYSLRFEASFSSSKEVTKSDPLIFCTLNTKIKIYSGIQNVQRPLGPPPLPHNVPNHTCMVNKSPDVDEGEQVIYTVGDTNGGNLPSYDEVLYESNQDARRRKFQQNENYFYE